MSTAKNARPLDPDAHPWERQPDEADESYRMFVAYRDMPVRNMQTFNTDEFAGRGWNDRKARQLSSQWSWGFRCFKFDNYMAALDVEEMARHRRIMNRRHIAVAQDAQAKIAEWLKGLKVADLTPFEAARWYELAVRVERDATGADVPTADLPDPTQGETAPKPASIGELMGVDPTVEADMARVLYDLTRRP